MANIPVSIKHIFLNFAQEYFKFYKKLPWDIEIQKTKILIIDKLTKDLGKTITRPSIILSRGAISFGFVPRNQDGTNAILQHQDGFKTLMGYAPNAGTFTTQSYTDLINGYVTYQVLAKSEYEADDIANHLVTGLIGYKERFRALGILKYTNLSISEGQLISIKTEPEFIGVNVMLGFNAQQTIFKDARNNDLRVFVDSIEMIENVDFIVIDNGTKIKFLYDTPIEYNKITIDYTDAITLQYSENIELIETDDPNIFSLSSGRILNYYSLLQEIEIDIEVNTNVN